MADWHKNRFVENLNYRRVECAGCGKPMWLPPSKASMYRSCGEACKQKLQDERKARRDRNCLVCGASFRPRAAQLRNGGGKFCSHKCNGVAFTGSGNPFFGKQMDDAAKARWRATRDKNESWFVGEKNVRWKGGRFVGSQGYVLVKAGDEYVLEHRFVMEQHIGRPLLDTEIVHHINENKQDNRIENLQIMSRAEHNRIHRLLEKQRVTSTGE